MTEDLVFLATITLAFILLVFYLSSKHNAKVMEMMEKDKQQYTKPSRKTIKKSDQVIDTLDWMLMHNIITPEEYTKLIGKCLPFLQ